MMYHDMTEEDQRKVRESYFNAVKKNRMKNMMECIQKGFPIETQDEYGSNALHKASLYGYFDMVKYLVEECHIDITLLKTDGSNALHRACYGGHIDIVKYFIEQWKNINIDLQNNNGHTSLLRAMTNDCVDIVQYLLDDGNADITLTTNDGENVFDAAYKSKFRNDMVVMLLTRLHHKNKSK
jgi:ankyrin repeat protein